MKMRSVASVEASTADRWDQGDSVLLSQQLSSLVVVTSSQVEVN